MGVSGCRVEGFRCKLHLARSCLSRVQGWTLGFPEKGETNNIVSDGLRKGS